jgi:hypothetical protein
VPKLQPKTLAVTAVIQLPMVLGGCVRHQMIWDYFRFDLEEDWPHLIVDDYAAAFR